MTREPIRLSRLVQSAVFGASPSSIEVHIR